jgi:hypothetical protein
MNNSEHASDASAAATAANPKCCALCMLCNSFYRVSIHGRTELPEYALRTCYSCRVRAVCQWKVICTSTCKIIVVCGENVAGGGPWRGGGCGHGGVKNAAFVPLRRAASFDAPRLRCNKRQRRPGRAAAAAAADLHREDQAFATFAGFATPGRFEGGWHSNCHRATAASSLLRHT